VILGGVDVLDYGMILVSKPKALHIPYFAMEGEPKNHIWNLDLAFELDNRGSPKPDEERLFGRKTVAWIRERLDHGASIQLYGTRDYIPKQTALHLKWLALWDDALRDEFLNTWPHYHIENQIVKLERERNEIRARLEARIQRGGFDLSKIAADQRGTVAYRYCQMDSKIRDLDWQIRYLREAIKLSEVWRERAG
jgi:hypothetical protein